MSSQMITYNQRLPREMLEAELQRRQAERGEQ